MSVSALCEAVRQTVSADLDGEASALERARAERHLEGCAACRAYAAAAAAATAGVRATPPVEPSRPLFPAAVAVRRTTLHRRRVLARRAATAVAAAASLAAAALLGAFVAGERAHAPETRAAPVFQLAEMDAARQQHLRLRRDPSLVAAGLIAPPDRRARLRAVETVSLG